MKAGKEKLAAAGVRNVSQSDFDTLIEVAAELGTIRTEDCARLRAFRDDPKDESWMQKTEG